ncbi:unnamed protein product [Kluyveromyces dobzhanskii CBS 2104]|uniref:WGS project CCBQ000000000 data, contig 00015 n=1 Tax=Kluyveromyces dobzhanskii CBS 2104 TaxID=1427455 RepID=A0A0A8LB68_9SACH|nr:unnamed protein product [Kluyveromyces dobzhanskii CBS 2104]
MSLYQNAPSKKDAKLPSSGGTDTVPLLITLEQNIQLLKRKTHLVGTSKDGKTLRADINGEIIPEIQAISRKLADSTSLDSQDKFARDLQSLTRQFNSIKADYESKTIQNPIPESESNDEAEHLESQYESMPIQEEIERKDYASEQTPLLVSAQQQELLLNQEELDFHTIIQNERSQDISKIHSAVQEVNAIFKQLGSLVQEQGDQVDTIGENVTGLSHNLQTANKELQKANEYQKKKNRCGTIFLVAVVIVTLITLLAVLS